MMSDLVTEYVVVGVDVCVGLSFLSERHCGTLEGPGRVTYHQEIGEALIFPVRSDHVVDP